MAFIIRKSNQFAVVILCLFYSASNFAKAHSVEFFYSNNDRIISIQQAYQRLTGQEQHDLKKNAIRVLQQQHMELGEFKNTLGTYTMQNGYTTTADNSEVFLASSLQKLSRGKIFSVAAMLANELKQENVAVFIPATTNKIAYIKLVFKSNKPSISDVIQLIQNKLPKPYLQAFTLNLRNTSSGFNLAEVKSIEWLGNNIDSTVFKDMFPLEAVQSYSGESYLVFKYKSHQKL